MHRQLTYMNVVWAVIIAGFLMAPLAMATSTATRAANVTSDVPRVVASIAPVGGLVARVMAGVGQPAVLITGVISPHGYNLKPSDAQLLEAAQAVFWIGPDLVTALKKPIKALTGMASVVSFMTDPTVTLLAQRKAGVLLDDHGHDHQSNTKDPHIWLDPQNAAAMLMIIARTLGELDPDRAAQYNDNARRGVREMRTWRRLSWPGWKN